MPVPHSFLAPLGAFVATALAAGTVQATPQAGVALRFDAGGITVNNCCFANTMATADVNGDGRPDLVTGNGFSSDISVLLAQPGGGFADPLTVTLGNVEVGYVAVALGDLDGDGHVDLVANGYAAGQVETWRGDGQGGFTPSTVLTETGSGGVWTRALAVADIDGDGHLDIVAGSREVERIVVFRGDGAGAFPAPQAYVVGAGPVAIVARDLDGDGHVDLAVANAESLDITVLRGSATGTFTHAQTIPLGASTQPASLAVGDLDGDGHLDLATANAIVDEWGFPSPDVPGSASVVRGTASGVFAAAQSHAIGEGGGRGQTIAIADVTADGVADLVVTRPISNHVAVLAGDGNGGLLDAVLLPTSVGPTSLVVVDANGDGHVDVVAGNAVSANLSILPGNGQGMVGFRRQAAVGRYPHAITTGDFNGDGHMDVATANLDSNDVSILLGHGDGTFAPEVRHTVGMSPVSITAGDLDGDGHLDLVAGNLGGGSVSVLRGNGTGGFANAVAYPVGRGFEGPYAIVIGDANGDGRPDIATANSSFESDSVSYLAGNAQGGFAPALTLPVGPAAGYMVNGLVFADVTGDGHADLVTANGGNDTVSLLVGNGAGQFAAAQVLAGEGGPVIVRAADVTGDGIVDLVTVNQYGHSISVFAGTGSGAFAVPVSHAIYPAQVNYEYEPWAWGMVLADLDGDGIADVATANTQNDTVSVLVGDGSGGFSTPLIVGTGAHPGSIAVADIDGDGRPDLLTANRQNNNVSVLRNVAAAADTIFADGFD
ncbi:FG-GAP repeat domain-containing protein [Dokdonella sp. MW10]|uniref:FG-GAP repeat domain-containing protein n=1 Tax=Dokdonella sp. MW10 TaxID=2992926 RepID=UPI003F7E6126